MKKPIMVANGRWDSNTSADNASWSLPGSKKQLLVDSPN